ncbi:ATP-binding protein [Pseudoalteromonas sp. TB64]|uniref:ATP-binding protein n=1 Tax=Pseudoalteromonas sp. TB64 TaxID=1938600 RepID=UPI0004029533|nr:ATP-binding protein [Pseudoalteromonas sp. TB64]
MNNIIRRVMVVGLFEPGNDYLIEFDNGSNCLFGDNGTGKTTLINLIVAVLAGDIGVLTDIEFEYVEITIEKKGEFSEVSVYKSLLPVEDNILDTTTSLSQHRTPAHRHNTLDMNPFNRSTKGIDESDYSFVAYVLDGEEVTFQYPTYEGRIFFYRRIMKSRKHQALLQKLSSLINLTHVPLLRVKSNEWDSMDESELARYKKWDSKTESSRFDASTVVLKEIEDAFKCMAVDLTREDNKKLESFKSQIVQKFLIGKEIHSTFPKLAEESKRDSYVVEDLFEQLKYAGLEVPKEKLKENFETLARLDDETRLAVEYVETLKSQTNLNSEKKRSKSRRESIRIIY